MSNTKKKDARPGAYVVDAKLKRPKLPGFPMFDGRGVWRVVFV